MRLESKFGRIGRALKTSRALLNFWRCSANSDAAYDDDLQTYHTVHSINNEGSVVVKHNENGTSAQKLASSCFLKLKLSFQGSVVMLSSKDVLGPMTTPIFTAPLGIPAGALPQHGTINSASTLELAEAASNLGHATTTRLSEIGGAQSTTSDSLGIGTSSSLDWNTMNTFRVRVS